MRLFNKQGQLGILRTAILEKKDGFLLSCSTFHPGGSRLLQWKLRNAGFLSLQRQRSKCHLLWEWPVGGCFAFNDLISWWHQSRSVGIFCLKLLLKKLRCRCFNDAGHPIRRREAVTPGLSASDFLIFSSDSTLCFLWENQSPAFIGRGCYWEPGIAIVAALCNNKSGTRVTGSRKICPPLEGLWQISYLFLSRTGFGFMGYDFVFNDSLKKDDLLHCFLNLVTDHNHLQEMECLLEFIIQGSGYELWDFYTS